MDTLSTKAHKDELVQLSRLSERMAQYLKDGYVKDAKDLAKIIIDVIATIENRTLAPNE